MLNLKEQSPYKLKFLLALLNSRLLNYFYKNKYKSTKKVFSEIQAHSLGKLPIANTENQGVIINLVDKILEQKIQNSNTDTLNLEHRIDELVMDLYGLTEKEKEIIRNS